MSVPIARQPISMSHSDAAGATGRANPIADGSTAARRHLTELVATAPEDNPPLRFTAIVFSGDSDAGVVCDSAVQAAVDAACCDPPFTAVVDCPGTSAIQSASCPGLQSVIFCCAA